MKEIPHGCPSCGALPCDWVNTPTIEQSSIVQNEAEIVRLTKERDEAREALTPHETLQSITAWAIVLDGKSYDVDPPRRICPDQINPRNIYAQELGAKQAGGGREVVQVLITPLRNLPLEESKKPPAS